VQEQSMYCSRCPLLQILQGRHRKVAIGRLAVLVATMGSNFS
jgi:hypothetical protein